MQAAEAEGAKTHAQTAGHCMPIQTLGHMEHRVVGAGGTREERIGEYEICEHTTFERSMGILM